MGHTAKVGDIKRQQVGNGVGVADCDKPSVMDLLADNPMAGHYGLPGRIDIWCVLDQREGSRSPLPTPRCLQPRAPSRSERFGRVAICGLMKTCGVERRISPRPVQLNRSAQSHGVLRQSLLFASRPNTLVSTR